MSGLRPPPGPAAWLSQAARPHIVRGSVQVSLVVGVLLNLVNQGGALWGGHVFSWRHALLNFVVPYGVSTYGAVRVELARLRDRAGALAEPPPSRPS